jgi:hypothetical protein
MVCYVSAFQLNVNDWFTEYEHIEIFNLNLQKELGMWLTYALIYFVIGGKWAKSFSEAVMSPNKKRCSQTTEN